MSTRSKRRPLCEKGTVSAVPSREPMPFRHVTALQPDWPAVESDRGVVVRLGAEHARLGG